MEFSVGEVLVAHGRFSLLAKPGGGKSTLLKRLAVAYADPARRPEADDQLPERDWLPLLLRCRELRDRAHRPLLELLEDLAKHAGMNADETKHFRDQINEALRSGRALLLVDGLDEISDEGTRTTFAGHLRSFLAMFPNVAMVVTSREAGIGMWRVWSPARASKLGWLRLTKRTSRGCVSRGMPLLWTTPRRFARSRENWRVPFGATSGFERWRKTR